MTDFDAEVDLPRHDCLELVHVCYQPLQTELGRRVVTMEKVKEYNVAERKKYLSSAWINGTESAEKCANIRERLIEAAKLKPGYEEKAAFRKKRRLETKEAKKKAKRENAAPVQSSSHEDSIE
jgi:tRNA (guanine10-N2)-methyltransferase